MLPMQIPKEFRFNIDIVNPVSNDPQAIVAPAPECPAPKLNKCEADPVSVGRNQAVLGARLFVECVS